MWFLIFKKDFITIKDNAAGIDLEIFKEHLSLETFQKTDLEGRNLEWA